MRWARDPWREKGRIGRLKESNGVWLESDEDRVRCLVSEVFVVPVNASKLGPWGVEGCPMSKEDLEESVRRALGRTKNRSATGPDGISYRLIKAIRDIRLGRELIEEVVGCLHAMVIPEP